MTLKTTARSARRLMERVLRFGPDDLRRTTPLHPAYGYHRGTPADRHYIDRFLATESTLVRGDAIEIAEDRYISRIGGARLTSATTFQLSEPGPGRLVGDLTRPDSLPENAYDCFVCTQTLNVIYDVQTAIVGCHRLLKPGGTLLLAVAGTTHLSRYDADRWGDYWRFTPQSLAKLLAPSFGANVRVSAYGNVLAATAMLHGIVCEELTTAELDVLDPDYPVTVCAVATKSGKPA